MTTTPPGVTLGPRTGPFPGRLDAELLRSYARATGDPNPGPRVGEAVPPAAIVTQIWQAQQVAFQALVPAAVRRSMTGGVHGEQDIVLHRPISPGEELETWVEGLGSRRGGRHNLVTLRYTTFDRAGQLVAEQWWTTVLLNAIGEPVGEAPPDHTLADEARQKEVGRYRVEVDDDMPSRYAEVSSDWSDHHFRDEAAQRSGFERRFLHGLCTMALCAQGVVALMAGGDPGRVRRLAVRFASPTYVGSDLELCLYEAGQRTYGFEAEADGALVIRNGLVELRP